MFSLRWQFPKALSARSGPAVTLTRPDMEMQQMLRSSNGSTADKNSATGRGRGLRDSSPSARSNEQEVMRPVVEEKEEGELGRMQLVTVVAALVCSIFLCSLDMTIIATAIPRITDRFKSLEDVGWYGSAFLLTIACSQSSWGKAYKHFDLKAVFLVSIAVFELGSLICAVAQTSATLIVGRAITGLGAAGVVAGCYSIIAYSVAPHKRPAFTGILGATYGIASVLGPLLGGVFTDSSLTWRWCFWINLPIGAVSATIIYFTFTTPLIQRGDPARRIALKEKILQLDLPGMLVLAASIVSLLLAMQWGGVSKPWNSPTIIALLAVFALLLCCFGMVGYRQGERAMLVPHVVRKREVWAGGIFVFFVGAALFTLVYFLPLYFQAVQGTSAVTSAVQNLALILAITISTIVCGAIITLDGRFTPLLVLGSVLSTVGCALVYTLSLTSTSALCIGSQVLTGVGLGLSFQTPVMAAQALSETEDLATTSAILVFFQTMGGAIFVSAAQSAFANRLIRSIVASGLPLSPASVLGTGATELQKTFEGAELEVIRKAYMDGLTVTFTIALGLASTSVVLGPLSPWVNIKGKVSGIMA